MKRLIDIVFSAAALLVLSPVMLTAVLGIKLASKGPVFYRAERAGRNGTPFTMYKFRTMHTEQGGSASRITAAGDTRIFGWGKLLRTTKIDELPQLWNVLRGDMSIVGPRPEDVTIVREHYQPWMMESLEVRPGMASPGSLYGSVYDYRCEKQGITVEDPERVYLENLLPIKIAIEIVYVRNASIGYDMKVIMRTLALIGGAVLGRHASSDPPEYPHARGILESETL